MYHKLIMATPNIIPYTDFKSIPESKYSAKWEDGDMMSAGGLIYTIESIVGIGTITTKRYIQQYVAGIIEAGIVLGRENGSILLTGSILRSLTDGKYFASDVEGIKEDRILSIVVHPMTLDELLPYNPQLDEQSDLDRKHILPALRHKKT